MASTLQLGATMSADVNEPKTILVPVDFDDASRRAVEHAVEYARALGARIRLLHVVPPTSFPEGTRLLPLDASDPVDLGEYVSARAKRLLAETFLESLMMGVEVAREARSGHPVETILRAIDDCGASLVIVGTHGRTGAARLLLGSVAEEIVRRSHVPVLVIRGPHKAAENAEPLRLARSA
jgi:nucleotide-binding universal stress UspA family protein